MGDDRPTHFRHLAGHGTQRRGAGEAFGFLALVLILEASVFAEQARRGA